MIRRRFPAMLAVFPLLLAACEDSTDGDRSDRAGSQPGDADIPIRGAFDDAELLEDLEPMDPAELERA